MARIFFCSLSLIIHDFLIIVVNVKMQIMGNLGSADIDSRLEEQLIDGILYAFQEQTQEVSCFHC